MPFKLRGIVSRCWLNRRVSRGGPGGKMDRVPMRKSPCLRGGEKHVLVEIDRLSQLALKKKP